MDKWTGKEYFERATKFRKDKGAESHPVITREKHPHQWRDWYAWYGYRGLEVSQELMREKEEKTVPALSPFDFDAGFNPRLPSSEVPRAHVDKNWAEPTAEQKQRVKNLMAKHFRPRAS